MPTGRMLGRGRKQIRLTAGLQVRVSDDLRGAVLGRTNGVKSDTLGGVPAASPFPLPFSEIPFQDGPDLEPILQIHRAPDGFVRFMVKAEDGALKPIASIRADQLRQRWLPGLLDHLAKDAYFSLAGFHRGGTGAQADLRYLNAAYVDLDFYNAGVDRSIAFATLIRAQDSQVIPPASIIVDSGRGLWAIYLLISDIDAGLPPRYWSETIGLYRDVQRALHDALRQALPSLWPDRNAMDATRVARVPGSLNTASGGRVVKYWIQGGELSSGGRFVYTLDQLADFFALPLPGRDEVIEIKAADDRAQRHLLPRPRRPVPKRRKGWHALLEKRLADLETLRTLRSGIIPGTRNAFMWVYSVTLRKLGARDEEIAQRLRQLWRDCHQPARNMFSPGEALRYVELSKPEQWARLPTGAKPGPGGRWKTRALIEMLRVTDEEFPLMTTIRPDVQQLPVKRRSRAARRCRYDAVRAIVQELGRAPSCRELQRLLQARGFKVSFRTASVDLRELGLENSPRPASPGPAPATIDTLQRPLTSPPAG